MHAEIPIQFKEKEDFINTCPKIMCQNTSQKGGDKVGKWESEWCRGDACGGVRVGMWETEWCRGPASGGDRVGMWETEWFRGDACITTKVDLRFFLVVYMSFLCTLHLDA